MLLSKIILKKNLFQKVDEAYAELDKTIKDEISLDKLLETEEE